MTNLSPAAQQVFWEFNRAASGKPDDWHYLPAIAAALRPKPPSLKEQALEAMHRNWNPHNNDDFDTIRRALEALPDD